MKDDRRTWPVQKSAEMHLQRLDIVMFSDEEEGWSTDGSEFNPVRIGVELNDEN